jgi:hypothetical protein
MQKKKLAFKITLNNILIYIPTPDLMKVQVDFFCSYEDNIVFMSCVVHHFTWFREAILYLSQNKIYVPFGPLSL